MEDSILGLAELQAENRPVELGKHWGILGGGGRALSQSGDKLTWQGRGGTGRARASQVTPGAAGQRGTGRERACLGYPRAARKQLLDLQSNLAPSSTGYVASDKV